MIYHHLHFIPLLNRSAKFLLRTNNISSSSILKNRYLREFYSASLLATASNPTTCANRIRKVPCIQRRNITPSYSIVYYNSDSSSFDSKKQHSSLAHNNFRADNKKCIYQTFSTSLNNDKNKKEGEGETQIESILTQMKSIPNIITFIRIFPITPSLSYFIITNRYDYACVGVFVAAFSDFLDGFIAKNFKNQSTVLGTYLDPLADKIFLNTLGLSLTYQQIIPMWTFGTWAIKDFGLMITTYWWVKKHTPNTRTEDDSSTEDSSSNTIVVNPATTPLKVQPTLISKINTVLQFNTLGVGMIVGGLGNTTSTKTDAVVENNGSEVLDNAITILQNNADIATNTLTGLCYLTAFTTILSCFSYIGGGSLVSSGNKMSKEQNNK